MATPRDALAPHAPAALPAAAPSALAPGLSRKLRKVLETRTDSADVLTALEALGELFPVNTAAARRGLRATVEAQGLAINEALLAAAEPVQEALRAVEAEVGGLSGCVDRMSGALDACAAQTGELVGETERLKLELDASAKRLELVREFLERYQLTPAEVHALREGDLGEAFFAALARVQEIHTNCKALLRTHHQRAGLELMDAMAAHQEGAYERLCRWVQKECREIGEGDAPEVPEELRRAAGVLRRRAVLFRYCAEEVANARHSSLFRRFLAALTRGGPQGVPRPIEVHAHDPLRYVGDMCGWLHQAMAEEHELATALFGEVAEREADTGASNGNGAAAEGDEEEVSAAEVLDRVFEGVCRPFKARVEQVLTAAPDVSLAFKLANLLEFYTLTVGKVLTPTASLTKALRQCHAAAQQAFLQLLHSKGAKLVRNPPAVPRDLGVPAEVAQATNQLCALLNTHADAMTAPSVQGGEDLEQLLSAVLDPVMAAIESAASSYSDAEAEAMAAAADIAALPGAPPPRAPPTGLASPKARTFAMNNIDALSVALLAAPPSSEAAVALRLEALAAAREAHFEAAVQAEIEAVMEGTGLAGAFAAAQGMMSGGDKLDAGGAACELPHIAAGLEKLYAVFTVGGGGGGGGEESGGATFPSFGYMRVDARKGARARLARALAAEYEALYLSVATTYGREGQQALQRTPDDVRVILGV